MKIIRLKVRNFRGIKEAEILFDGHTVLIGDNNAGKSTILEAIDLVLGPDRLSRFPVINEHDFYNGLYIDEEQKPIPIKIEVIIGGLSDEQKRKFNGNLEFWDTSTLSLIDSESASRIQEESVEEVIRVEFDGRYDDEDDDFVGETFFCSPIESTSKFTKSDKRDCGFLYLRAIRTGSRALSLERGSLLDVILRIKNIRPQMWENILGQLKITEVNSGKADEVNEILADVQTALKQFVPTDWGSEPQLKVSNLTREHLRKTLVVFMSTGSDGYSVPFNHQGTGTINTMVLALLSMIAELKHSVIFAMEEPEIAIPPYTQKRIITSIRSKSAQAIFTSHSPFVLEEFQPKNITLVQRNNGSMTGRPIVFPSTIKPKAYSKEFRMRFAESLLAKRVLLAEGDTESLTYSATARHISELKPEKYMSFEAMGMAIFNAESENNIPIFGKFFSDLGKTTFAVFDKQKNPANRKLITDEVDYPFESEYKGLEDLVLKEIPVEVLTNYAQEIKDCGSWPTHIKLDDDVSKVSEELLQKALRDYFIWQKASGSVAELISKCKINDVPKTLRSQIRDITNTIKDV